MERKRKTSTRLEETLARVVAQDCKRRWRHWKAARACLENDLDKLKELVNEENEVVNRAELCGKSLLALACENGAEQVGLWLLDNGAFADVSDYNDVTPLHCASKCGLLEVLKSLLKFDIDVNILDSRKRSPLHFACEGGHVEAVQFLLRAGAVVNSQSEDRLTPLHEACEKGHVQVVRELVQQGAAVNVLGAVYKKIRYKDYWDELSPIASASRHGHLEIVKCLFEAGALTSPRNSQSPLVLAAMGGHADVVRFLVEKGCKPEDLMAARSETKLSKEIDTILRSYRYTLSDVINAANANSIFQVRVGSTMVEIPFSPMLVKAIKSCQGELVLVWKPPSHHRSKEWTLLHLAAMGKDTELVKQICALDMVDVNARTERKQTPLHLACEQDNTGMVRTLLEQGADVNLDGEFGTPLDVASRNGNIEIVRMLLQAGAQACGKIASGMSPIHYACENGHAEVVRFLLQAGAQFTVYCSSRMFRQRQTPLDFACAKGHTEVVQLLLQAGAQASRSETPSTSPLHHACMNGHAEIVRLLLEAGVKASSRDELQRTPLHVTKGADSSLVASLLISAGVDTEATDKDGQTALEMACKRGDTALVQALVAYSTVDRSRGFLAAAKHGKNDLVKFFLETDKAVLYAVDSEGRTALHLACLGESSLEVFEALLARGLKVDERCQKALPLVEACMKEKVELVRTLLDLGADASQPDAITVAVETGNVEIVKMLLQAGANVNYIVCDYECDYDSDFFNDGICDMSLLDLAAHAGHEEVQLMLVSTGIQLEGLEGLEYSLPIVCKKAAKKGSAKLVKHLIESGVHVDYWSDSFEHVVARGDVEVMEELMRHATQVCRRSNALLSTDFHAIDMEKRGELLLQACSRREYDQVEGLLQAGTPPTTECILKAFDCGRLSGYEGEDIVMLLLKHGVRVDQEESLLEICCRRNAWKVLELLLDAGANPTGIKVSTRNPYILESLLQAGVETTSVSIPFRSPSSTFHDYFVPYWNGYREVLRILQREGRKHGFGLHCSEPTIAICSSDTACLRVMVQAGLDLRTPLIIPTGLDSGELNPYIYATTVPLVNLFLSAGADLHRPFQRPQARFDSCLLLSLLRRKSPPHIIELVIQAGARGHTEGRFLSTYLDEINFLRYYPPRHTLALFVAHGAPIPPESSTPSWLREFLEIFSHPFSPEFDSVWPPAFVKVFRCVAGHSGSPIPKDLFLHVLSFCPRLWFSRSFLTIPRSDRELFAQPTLG